MPLLSLGASALAATNAAMLIHSNRILGLAVAFSFGAFLAFQCLENTMEESGGLLRDIEADIIVRACREGRARTEDTLSGGAFQPGFFAEGTCVGKWDSFRTLNLVSPFISCCRRRIMLSLMLSWSTLGLKCG